MYLYCMVEGVSALKPSKTSACEWSTLIAAHSSPVLIKYSLYFHSCSFICHLNWMIYFTLLLILCTTLFLT